MVKHYSKYLVDKKTNKKSIIYLYLASKGEDFKDALNGEKYGDNQIHVCQALQ